MPRPDIESQSGESTPAVTVTIPTYNGGSYLRAAIDSVLSQTFVDWELFVSDDSSTDGSTDFLRALMEKDRRVHYIRNLSRLGLPQNFTQCAQLGSGRFVAIFHQDDVMLPDNLAAKVAMLDAHPDVGMVHSNIEQIDDAGTVFAEHWDTMATKDAILSGRVFLERTLSNGNIVCAPTAVVRRSVFREVGSFDPRLPWVCDWDMWIRIALRHHIGVIGRPQVQWRDHQNQEGKNFESSLRGLRQIALLFELLFNERAPNLRRDRRLRLAAQGTLARWAVGRATKAWQRGQRSVTIKMWAFVLLKCPDYLVRVPYRRLRRR